MIEFHLYFGICRYMVLSMVNYYYYYNFSFFTMNYEYSELFHG